MGRTLARSWSGFRTRGSSRNDGLPGGNYAIVGNTANKWFRLFGDANGDGRVDLIDFVAFRSALGSQAPLAAERGSDGAQSVNSFSSIFSSTFWSVVVLSMNFLPSWVTTVLVGFLMPS